MRCGADQSSILAVSGNVYYSGANSAGHPGRDWLTSRLNVPLVAERSPAPPFPGTVRLSNAYYLALATEKLSDSNAARRPRRSASSTLTALPRACLSSRW
jgi:hypothetical protein